VTWKTAAYISRASDGQANVFDPWAEHDSWEFDGNFRCTPAQAATLGAIFRANLDVQIYPDGFSPFGPLHADNAYTVKMKVCEHGQILENPYRMYAVRLVFELTSALTSITSPAGKLEGAFALGSVSELRMPGSTQDIWRAVRVLDRSGGNPAMAKTENPWTDSALSIEGREANICRVMEYLEDQRYSNLTAVSQDKYYLFGAEIGNGVATAKRVSNEITYSMIEHDAWSFDLPLNFRSIVPLPTPGDYTLLYLDESDISMLTADGSSGASTYQLTPVFDDPAGAPTACSWSSSNPSAVEVDHTGLCTCVGAGTATITATKDAVSKTCSVTGFATMPSVASLYVLKGGSAAGTADISPFFVMTSQNDGDANNDSCIVAMEHRPSGAGVYSGLIRTSGCGVINPSLFDGDDWKPYYNINNGSGTEFVYKLAGYTQVADTLIKETHHYNGSQYSVNGSAYTATLTGSSAAPFDGSIQINFLNNIKKYA
jgi:hypothetical protein